jgi:hypothetical protein
VCFYLIAERHATHKHPPFSALRSVSHHPPQALICLAKPLHTPNEAVDINDLSWSRPLPPQTTCMPSREHPTARYEHCKSRGYTALVHGMRVVSFTV